MFRTKFELIKIISTATTSAASAGSFARCCAACGPSGGARAARPPLPRWDFACFAGLANRVTLSGPVQKWSSPEGDSCSTTGNIHERVLYQHALGRDAKTLTKAGGDREACPRQVVKFVLCNKLVDLLVAALAADPESTKVQKYSH